MLTLVGTVSGLPGASSPLVFNTVGCSTPLKRERRGSALLCLFLLEDILLEVNYREQVEPGVSAVGVPSSGSVGNRCS